MKLLLWVVTLLVLALWTGTVWVMTGLADWLAAQAAAGQGGDLAAIIAQWPAVPPEFAPWLGELFLVPLRDLFAWTVSMLAFLQPIIPGLFGILSVLLWILWFIVTALVLVLAVLGHWAIGKAHGVKRMLQTR